MPARTGGVLPASNGRVTAVARELGPVAATVTVADSTGDMYQLDAGTLPADGREHVLEASLGGADVSYPLRLVQIALSYQLPPVQATALALTVTGPALSGWHASATSPDLQNLRTTAGAEGASALPASQAWEAAGDTATFTFSSGFGAGAQLHLGWTPATGLRARSP